MKELWRDVVDYEGEYMVSNKGRVMSLKSEDKPAILKTFLSEGGYPRINLMKDGDLKQVFVHRLVVQSFIGEIEDGLIVNHIDGNKENNNMSNLEIVTQSENALHSCHVLGNHIKAVYMLDKQTLEPIREFPSISAVKDELGIDDGAISKVCAMQRNFAGGYSWAYKEDYSKELIERKKKKLAKGFGRRVVYQVDPLTNKVINEFDGVRVAERKLGISTIKQCLAGLTKTAGGYKWSYDKPEQKIG